MLDELERSGAATVIRSETNLGYAGAVNRVLPRCRGRYVGVVNVDVEAEPDWLEPLVEFMDGHPEVGAVSPLIMLADGAAINAAGQELQIAALGFNRGLDQPRESVGECPFAVTGLHGAAFVIRRAVLERAEGMDATGFLYHEDVNLSWLLRMMGEEIYCIPASVLHHDYFLTMDAAKFHLLERNRVAMLQAYLEPRTRLLLAPVILFTEAVLWSYAAMRGAAFLSAKLRSYRWVRHRREEIAVRRRLGERVRTRSDLKVLHGLKWGYPLPQLRTLAGERRGVKSVRNRAS